MKGYMYILECADGSYYTGSTKNLEKRLWEHDNFQGANYTRKKHPSKLVYVEEFTRIDEAFYREKQVQGWSHAKKKALIEANRDKLVELSKNYTQFPRKPVASTSSATGHSATGHSATGHSATYEKKGTPATEPVEVTDSTGGV